MLDRELFLHIDELRYVADRWRLDYNHYRPHSSLDYMAPAAFAAMCLEDSSTVVVGTGAPCAAAMLAQKTHAPDLVILFEAGGFAPLLPTMPISVGDSWTYYKVVTATSMDEIMEACQKGLVDYTFLGGAQIDMYGNLNSTMIGDNFHKPKVRFPGSGGANDLASLCWRIIVMTPQDRRKFVKKLDFLTTLQRG